MSNVAILLWHVESKYPSLKISIGVIYRSILNLISQSGSKLARPQYHDTERDRRNEFWTSS